jgi:hypothetical protein
MQFGVNPAYIGHLRPLVCLMAVLRASKRLYGYIQKRDESYYTSHHTVRYRLGLTPRRKRLPRFRS